MSQLYCGILNVCCRALPFCPTLLPPPSHSKAKVGIEDYDCTKSVPASLLGSALRLCLQAWIKDCMQILLLPGIIIFYLKIAEQSLSCRY